MLQFRLFPMLVYVGRTALCKGKCFRGICNKIADYYEGLYYYCRVRVVLDVMLWDESASTHLHLVSDSVEIVDSFETITSIGGKCPLLQLYTR